MSYNIIKYLKKNQAVYITLSGSRINRQMAQELVDACFAINQDDSINVVVITGSGNAFCSESEYGQEGHVSASDAIAGLNYPVIAAINGDAFGEGLELALACDMRLASEAARFGLPQIAEGLIPADGGTQRLPRIVGKGKALELILTGNTIDATTALVIGLVSKVVPPEKLSLETDALVESIAGKAPISLRYAKEAINSGIELNMEQGLRLEADLYYLLHTTSDRTEGIKAFLAKRRPEFKGQ